MSNRAVLYLRSSKDRSDVSIDAQRRALHDLAASRNLVVVEEYADAVESGKDDDRPAFQRLLRDIRQPARPWEWVLALDTSRVARRRLLAIIFEQECSKRGVRIVFKNLPESDPATDMIIRSVFQAFDEYHSLVSKAKGLAGMAENVRQGWRAGGRAPRGYRLEHIATGAIREGEPVMKSRLVTDDEACELVRGYLTLRAQGIARGPAVARMKLPWPVTSTHSMDWQALTYAGHTVWNMHSERIKGKTADGEKRRPRSEWVIQRDTHEPLITDDQAEAILAQMERARQGKRARETSLLLTGLLEAPDGQPWHSDGAGYYRLGKGKRIQAASLDRSVLDRLTAELCSEHAVDLLIEAMRTDVAVPTGQEIAGMERKIANLAQKIGRTVDLAADLDDPAPVLRRVADLEAQRSRLIDELGAMRSAIAQARTARTVSPADVRMLLQQLFSEIVERPPESLPEARQAIGQVLERIELDPDSMHCRLHFAVATGDKMASRSPSNISPVRWSTGPILIASRKRAA